MTKALLIKATALALVMAVTMAAKPVAETKLVMTVKGKGKVEITLDEAKAPKTCAHILALVQSKFYDGQKFIKAMKSPKPFLVQFGDPNSRTKDMDDPELGKTGSGTTI
ncbi:MAG: peptidylprolyl isomerase, partial [Armatimonadota bacterium]